ncbi:MAG: hypothetical protein H6Q72_1488 [Firmicutes bacterium]|nr:hypothetical protein [Bacillota bacterium]
MDELLKRILSEIQDLKKNMATKQDLTGINETMTKEIETVNETMTKAFKTLNDKIDSLAAESQKDVIAMIGLIDKKLDKKLDQIETKIDILDHRVAAQDGEIKLLKLAK